MGGVSKRKAGPGPGETPDAKAGKTEGGIATTESESEAGKTVGAIASTESASVGPTAASGALVIDPICVKPGPMSITSLLEMGSLSGEGYETYLRVWASETKSYVDKELHTFLVARPDKLNFKLP